MTLHQKNKILCIIPSLPNEPNEHYIDRCNFITSQKMKNDTDLKKNISLSYIYSNQKYLGCTYDNQTTFVIKQMIDNSYT
jgi:hypothetical protein